MIVCSCMRISDGDIRAAISWMRAADPHTLVTPGKVYRALGKVPNCGGCIRLFVAQMRTSRDLQIAADPPAPKGVPDELRVLRLSFTEDG